MRMQTFIESTFEFRVLVDPFATYNYVELPQQPYVPGRGRSRRCCGRRCCRRRAHCGETFRLGFKGEDKWGNPSDQVEGTFTLKANMPVAGLPATFTMKRGEHAKVDRGPVGARRRAIC